MITPELKQEILNDPESVGYGQRSNVEVLASLYAKTRSVLRVLKHPTLTRVLAENGRLAKLKRASEQWSDDTKDLSTSIAMVAVGFITRDDSHIDPGNPSDVALINALVSSGVLAASDKQALIDAATILISRVEELNLGKVRLGDVEKARA